MSDRSSNSLLYFLLGSHLDTIATRSFQTRDIIRRNCDDDELDM